MLGQRTGRHRRATNGMRRNNWMDTYFREHLEANQVAAWNEALRICDNTEADREERRLRLLRRNGAMAPVSSDFSLTTSSWDQMQNESSMQTSRDWQAVSWPGTSTVQLACQDRSSVDTISPSSLERAESSGYDCSIDMTDRMTRTPSRGQPAPREEFDAFWGVGLQASSTACS